MPFNNNITPGAPPLLWSDVNDAFTLINENFDILVATVGSGSGLTPVDFTSLDTSVSPTTDDLRDLGDATHKWGAVFSSEHTAVKPLNGLWAGAAQVKGIGLTINLPENSTIGGDPITGIGTSLIIDPDKTFFKIIEVDAGNSIVANTFGDTLNLISGSGVNMLVSSGADSITISNTGVLSVTAGSGISVATVSGTATVTNTGVRSLQSTTALPAGRTTGAGINITGATGDNIRVTNTGVISITSGVGITVSTDAATGDVTITNSAPSSNAYPQIEVNGDAANRLIAAAANDVLNITSGEGITLTKNPATDTLTITVNPVFDLRGSVFADDSTLLVDAVSGIVPAAVVSGTFTGTVIGNITGNVTGDVKGSVFGDDSTKIVDAVENKVFAEFFGNITGNAAGDHTGTFSGNVFSNLIDSADSSEINIVPSVNCNSDLTVGGDILPNSDLGGDLGSASKQWKSLFVSGSTIFIGGVAVSVENGALSVGGSATQEILVSGTNIKTINGDSILGSGDLVLGGAGTVTSISGTGTVDGLTLTGTVTSSGSLVLGGTLAIAATQVTSGTLAVARGGTGITAFGTGVATFLGTPSSANLAAAVTDETGTGALVFASTPTLVTPVLGVATATSVNKVAITAPATSATLTIANGKTLTANNTLTLSGTDATTMTFPSTSATIARTDAGQTFTGTQVMTSPRIVTGVNDTNGNELFLFTATGSAVNEVTLANAATGNAPKFTASGGDTNIDLVVSAKGTGQVKETVSSVNYALASQFDIGTAPNEIPLNQYLGSMAYLDADNISFDARGTNTAAQNLAINKLTTVVISADTTLTTTVPLIGSTAFVIVITSGATSRTVTFGTGFKSTGTLATGTDADRRFVFQFISDGTNLVEVSRTAAITY